MVYGVINWNALGHCHNISHVMAIVCTTLSAVVERTFWTAVIK